MPIRNNIPFEFVYNHLAPFDVYVNGKIMVGLRERKVHREANGVWIWKTSKLRRRKMKSLLK